MKRIKEHLDTQFRNMARDGHYKPDVVEGQLKELLVFSSHYFQTRDNIAVDKHLTPDGKSASRRKAAEPIIEEIAKWKDKRLGALDADIASSRAALLPPSTEKIEPRRIDSMLWHLRDHTAEERATFYNSATDAERLVMEQASASVGRMPVKTAQGLVWETILDSQLVNDAVLARAQAKNPAAAAKLAELQEIRDMHATAANIAIAEIRDTLNG